MLIRTRIIPVIGFLVMAGLAVTGARFASETAQASTELGGTVYWSDGESGRLSNGTKFSLYGIAAPETGSPTQRGGAKCEAERQLGFDARAVAVELTRGRYVTVSEVRGRDRHGRNIVRLSLDGQDVGALFLTEGLHQAWEYDSGAPKPDWCRSELASLAAAP